MKTIQYRSLDELYCILNFILYHQCRINKKCHAMHIIVVNEHSSFFLLFSNVAPESYLSHKKQISSASDRQILIL